MCAGGTLLLSLASPAFAADPAKRAINRQGLAGYLSADDYPAEAIQRNEQGTVGFRLDVGSDGQPTGCVVTNSSGSSILDATTCRIMTERARFEPARDAEGKPVPDQITSRVRWVLPLDIPKSTQAALRLWSTCVLGEASKLVPSSLPTAEIVRRSFLPCAELEVLYSKQEKVSVLPQDARKWLSPAVEQTINEVRAALQRAPEAQPGRQ